MLVPTTPEFRKRRGRAAKKLPASAPPALVLESAELIIGTPMKLRIAFDRTIDIAGLQPDAFSVHDPSGTGFFFVGDSVGIQPDTVSVEIGLVQAGSATGTVDRMTATASNGIVAFDDQGAWAGVSDLGLPYSG